MYLRPRYSRYVEKRRDKIDRLRSHNWIKQNMRAKQQQYNTSTKQQYKQCDASGICRHYIDYIDPIQHACKAVTIQYAFRTTIQTMRCEWLDSSTYFL